MREAEILMDALKAKEDINFDAFARNVVCNRTWRFASDARKIWVMGLKDGGMKSMGDIANEENGRSHRLTMFYDMQNARFEGAFELLVLNELVARHEELATYYASLGNAEQAAEGINPRSWKYFKAYHYPKGSATALDELNSRMRVGFLKTGWDNVTERRSVYDRVNVPGGFSLAFHDHADAMKEKICEALPEGFGEDVEPTGPVLETSFADLELYNGEYVTLDMGDHFNEGDFTYDVELTTWHKTRKTCRTKKLNQVARNKLTGAWTGDSLTLYAGSKGDHILLVNVTAALGEETASDEFVVNVGPVDDATVSPAEECR